MYVEGPTTLFSCIYSSVVSSLTFCVSEPFSVGVRAFLYCTTYLTYPYTPCTTYLNLSPTLPVLPTSPSPLHPLYNLPHPLPYTSCTTYLTFLPPYTPCTTYLTLLPTPPVQSQSLYFVLEQTNEKQSANTCDHYM